MKDTEENKKTSLKMEFMFQIGVIVFVLLGTVMKQASLFFWILAGICTICWVIFVQKEKSGEEKEKEEEEEP